MKLTIVLALVAYATAMQIRDAIPNEALALKGDALREYVNGVQSLWTATKYDRKFSNLMHPKYTKLPEDIVYADHVEPRADIPTTFDARKQWPKCESIGHIRDQSQCGSCWAFGAVEAFTDRFCIASGQAKNPFISAEDLLECCGTYCGYGCEGGYPIRAWNYMVQTGIVTGGGFYEQTGCKPYTIEPCGTHTVNGVTHVHDCSGEPEASTPSCKKSCANSKYTVAYNNDKYYGKTAYAVRENEATIQTEIMTNGPVEGAFTVYEDFYNYRSGIYKHTAGGVVGGHAIRILGWGEENGTKYWLVANSWNTDWGENGYFRIVRGKNECGIEDAIVAGLPKV